MMKTRITLKSLSELSPDADQITDAPSPAVEESPPQRDEPMDADFREMMHRRHSTPFPFQHWGLND